MMKWVLLAAVAIASVWALSAMAAPCRGTPLKYGLVCDGPQAATAVFVSDDLCVIPSAIPCEIGD